tara:strand:+ start:96 stop:524 length:429 start_codon:yes stop_codon:yes gene_type:complete
MKKLILILLFIPLVSFAQFPNLNEKSIRAYFDENGTEFIEGIWEYTAMDIGSYRLAILKEEFYYKAYILEKSDEWNVGELKATFERLSNDGNEIISKWVMADKVTKNTTQGSVFQDLRTISVDDALLSATADITLVKVYPKK